MALLRAVAAERRLLLIVDDVPWIDRASATVLAFVARRIGADPIVFLAAARTGAGGVFDQVRLPEREIGPLAEQPAAILLDTRYPDLAPAVRRRVHDEAIGNPLALLELTASLTDRQRYGQEPLPAFLPLNSRLEAAFASGMHGLPAPTRHLLLLAALEPDASLTTIRTAAQSAAQCGAELDDLAPAQRVGLIRTDWVAGRLAFCRPLVRSAIVQMTSPGEHRSAHRALAAALAGDPGRQAWHLAEATSGPDETVAQALEEAALSAPRRGRAPAAVASLVRAGELSPQPTDRSRRLVEAAYLANATGPLDQVTRLLADARQTDDARQASGTPTGSVFAAATALYLINGEGDIGAAHRLLARALDDADTAQATSVWVDDLLHALLFVCIFGDRPEYWQLLGEALARFDPDGTTVVRLCYDAFTDPARTSATVREGLARAFDALPADPAPWHLVPLAHAALWVDALSDYRHLVRRMIERERDGGAIRAVISGLLLLTGDSYHHGQWDEAENTAREGLDLAAAHGYHLLEGQIRGPLALIAALRGDLDLARALTKEITNWAAPRGVGLTQGFARYASAFAALAQGDYEDAYAQASRITPGGTLDQVTVGSWMVMDLVEAAIRTGHIAEARAYVAAAQEAGIARISSRRALVTAGAAALAADNDQARPLFEAALSLPEADRWPFGYARIHLAYGQWLRRTRDTTRARLHLRTALDIFDRLGARPWSVRAHNELRATGIPTTDRPDTRTAVLTSQERQIATLAASGLTNKQIGQQLFLSHRTVGAHLHRIFPKLGITSRAALRDALETIAPDGSDGPAQ
ncbi:LuxR C-terminal-related transcriptional regulator [Dactylosporangium darangshiense]